MSFKFTAAHSSRITKAKGRTPLRQPSSSSAASHPSRLQTSRSSRNKRQDEKDDRFEEHLPDTGLVATLVPEAPVQGAVQAVQYIKDSMFSAIPLRRAGMNSTRISELLSFRLSLPPVVNVAHVHAVSSSPTANEREIAALAKDGTARKLVLPSQGAGGSGGGEALVLTEDWQKSLDAAWNISDRLRGMPFVTT